MRTGRTVNVAVRVSSSKFHTDSRNAALRSASPRIAVPSASRTRGVAAQRVIRMQRDDGRASPLRVTNAEIRGRPTLFDSHTLGGTALMPTCCVSSSTVSDDIRMECNVHSHCPPSPGTQMVGAVRCAMTRHGIPHPVLCRPCVVGHRYIAEARPARTEPRRGRAGKKRRFLSRQEPMECVNPQSLAAGSRLDPTAPNALTARMGSSYDCRSCGRGS